MRALPWTWSVFPTKIGRPKVYSALGTMAQLAFLIQSYFRDISVQRIAFIQGKWVDMCKNRRLEIHDFSNIFLHCAYVIHTSYVVSSLERFLITSCNMSVYYSCCIQCNLDLVTLNLVTTCDLVTIFERPFFNLLHKIIRFSDIRQFGDSFCRDQKCH